jgi:hypothetical protein
MEIRNLWFQYHVVFLCVCFCFASVDTDQHDVISMTKRVKDSKNKDLGVIRYHHDPSQYESACSTILILGVGTAMSVSEYDKLSKQVASGTSIVVVISDHNEHDIRKTSPEKYARLANAINTQLKTLVPICSETATQIMIGGHSSSGEASMKAIQHDLLDFHPHGFVGLDPFEISEKTFGANDFILNIPAINWGFTKSTCLVTREKAAEGAYNLTSKEARVLYAITNDGGDCKITHCVFSDHGCGVTPFVCSTSEEYEWVFRYVAASIHLFVDAVSEQIPFTNHYFKLQSDHEVAHYVNDDEVKLRNIHETNLIRYPFESWKKFLR